ncbi:MAG: penicillin-binding protein activator [Nitrospinota bacterium]
MSHKRALLRSVIYFLMWAATALWVVSCAEQLRIPAPRQEIPQQQEEAFQIARQAFSQGNRTEAERMLREFLNRYPRSLLAPNASMYLGQIAYEKGQYNEALGWFSPYLKPGSPDPHRLRAHQWTGTIQKALGNPEAAGRHYRAALRLAKTDADRIPSLRQLARLALEGNRPAEAVEHLIARLPLIQEPEERRGLRQQTVDLIFLHLGLSDVERLAEKTGSGFPSGYLSVRHAELLVEAGKPEAARALLRDFLSGSRGHPLTERASRLMSSLPLSSGGKAEGTGPPRTVAPAWRAVLKVGILLPLSGAGAEKGQEAFQGVQLALQHAGRLAEQVKLQVLDSSGAESAAVQMRRLSSNAETAAILGLLDGPQASAAAKAAQAPGIPLILPTTPSSDSPAIPSYVFRTGISYASQAEAIAEHAIHKLSIRTFAILYPADSAGRKMREAFRRQVSALGGRVTREVSYPPGITDFGRQIRALGGISDEELERRRKARGEKADAPAKIPEVPFQALFIPDRSARVALIAPSLSFYNIQGVTLLGGARWNSSEIIALAKRDVEGAYFVGGYSDLPPTARRARFARDFQRAFSKAPTETAALTYDAMRFLLMGLQLSGAERAALRKALAETLNFDGVAGSFSIGPTGTAKRELPILTISQGEIVSTAGSVPSN